MVIPRSLPFCLVLIVTHFFSHLAGAQKDDANGEELKELGQVAFTEGPAWHPDGSVYFSDVENNRIMRMDAAGFIRVFRTPSGRANGLVFDKTGRLLCCEGGREGGNRRLTRTELNGTVTVLADRYEGKRFNSPNDITLDSLGNIYFTDPRYGDRSDVELLDHQGKAIEGVYRVGPEGRVSRILFDEVSRPNGIAVSPDGRFLFVADNANDDHGFSRMLLRFEFSAQRDIVPGSRKVLFDWGTERGPDGMAIDQEGRLYVAAGQNHPAPPHETAKKHKAGIYVISSEDGTLHDIIPVPIDMITNCAFGGSDRQTLFITAGHKLWSIRVATPGFLAWPTNSSTLEK
ncbi:MAG: SMP-30/gluconolactonase/LRE family protein [Pirellulaceae bacterium]|nr:SMP-30/gluconolactonase/LRE family protein [Pirellulaceae bacterium]